MGKHATLIDVGNNNHRTVGLFRKAHVGNIIGPQVDLGGAASAFHYHYLILLFKAAVRLHHCIHRDLFIIVVFNRIHMANSMAMDNHLSPSIARGLEQDRVHIGVGIEKAGLSLECLSAADLAAVLSDCTV